jgi:DnaJ family protein A protein 5
VNPPSNLPTSPAAPKGRTLLDKDFVMLFETYKKSAKMLKNVSAEEFVSFDDKKVYEKQLSVKECVQIAREYLRRFSLNRNKRKGMLKKKPEEKKNEQGQKAHENKEADEKERVSEQFDEKSVNRKQVLENMQVVKKLFGANNTSVDEMKAMKIVETKLNQIFSTSLLQQNLSKYFGSKNENRSENEKKKTISVSEIRCALEEETPVDLGVDVDDDEIYYATADGDGTDETETIREGEAEVDGGEKNASEDSDIEYTFFDEYNVADIDKDYTIDADGEGGKEDDEEEGELEEDNEDCEDEMDEAEENEHEDDEENDEENASVTRKAIKRKRSSESNSSEKK